MPGAAAKRDRRSPAPWSILAAAAWMLFFAGVALTLELPNNRTIDRWDLLSLAPGLIDLIDPPPPHPNDSSQALLIREHSGWRYFPQRFDPLTVAAVILAGAWGLGHLLLRAIGQPIPCRSLERIVFAFGLGLSALSLLTLFAGLAGLLSRALIGSLIAAALLTECTLRLLPPLRQGGAGGVAPQGRPLSHATRPPPNPPFLGGGISLRWLWLIVLAPFLLAMLLGALLPSVDFDVNEYHFQGPKEYFQNGRITFLPHNVYTSFPFATEMLTLLAMVLRDDWYQGALAGKCVLMAFGPLTGLALFAAGNRWFGPAAGAFAAVLYLTTPWTYRISTIAYAEGGLSFFLFTALFAVMIAFEMQRAVREKDAAKGTSSGTSGDVRSGRQGASRYFLLAGTFAGSAMACKYPGVVSVVIPMFAAVIWKGLRVGITEDRGSKIEDRIVQTSIDVTREKDPPQLALVSRSSIVDLRSSIFPFLLGLFLTIGPWLAKNTVETGNPVYPLLYTIFGGRDWDAELNVKWRNGHSPKQFALFGNPPEAEMSLVYSVVDVAARNDWVNSLLFACAALTLFQCDLRRRTAGLWLYTGYLFLTWWLLTHRIDRFWVPMAPVPALLAGAGAAWFWSAASPANLIVPWGLVGRLCRAAFVCCVAVITTVNLVLILSGLAGYNDFLLDMDVAKRFTATMESPELVLLNERLPAGSKVLSVGDAEMFEARFPVIYNTVFDHSIFEQWTADESSTLPHGERPLRDGEAIREKLAAEGITHIYVNWQDILRYRSPGNYGYTDYVTPRRFADLQRLGMLGPPWSIPEATMPVDRLDADQQDELREFAPELISKSNDKETFTTFQVFPVLKR